jgi:5'-phosphate synthase pdxT subunit
VTLEAPVLGPRPFHAVFIRAPLISRVGPLAEVVARLADGTVAAARQGKLLATSFHPELTDDGRFHRYFLNLVTNRRPAALPAQAAAGSAG